MLDLMIQISAVSVIFSVGLVCGDGFMRVVKGSTGLFLRIFPLVKAIMVYYLVPHGTVDSVMVDPVNDEMEGIEEKQMAGIDWVFGAAMWVTDEELKQQDEDENFTIKFSDYITVTHIVDVKSLKKVSDFGLIVGLELIKLKKGYRVIYGDLDSEFGTLKEIRVFLSQLVSNGERLVRA